MIRPTMRVHGVLVYADSRRTKNTGTGEPCPVCVAKGVACPAEHGAVIEYYDAVEPDAADWVRS